MKKFAKFSKISKFSKSFLLSLGFLAVIFSTQIAFAKNDVAEQIAQEMSRMMEAVTTDDSAPESKEIIAATKELQRNFAKILAERFEDKDLQQINAMFKEADFVKITKIMIQALTAVVENKGEVKDFDLKISKSYDQLIEKKIAEEKTAEKLRAFYIKDHANSGKDLTKEADKFVAITKKHIKKVISENFTEKQYRAYYDFEHSELGKRFYDAFGESVALSMKK